MMDLSLFARTIKEGRESYHYSQSYLAIRCDLDPSYISKIENNQLGYPPSQEAIAALADVLNLDEYRLTLMAGHIPSSMLSLIINFLLAYPEERAKEILEEAFLQAIL